MNKPLMSDKEIEIIDKLIEERRPRVCLEWGSGESTIYFPSKHSCIESWLSIEGDEYYKKDLDPRIKKNTEIFWTDSKRLYVHHPKGKTFDFILIDGRHRMKCLKVALKVIRNDGFILLHDSGRKEYDISKYKHKTLCEGEIPVQGGFAHRGLAIFEGAK